MKLLITSTAEIVLLDGVPCRKWLGVDAQGRECDVFVHRLGTSDVGLQQVMADELAEQPTPMQIVPRRRVAASDASTQ